LASLAATNERVHEALAPSLFPGLFAGQAGVYPALWDGHAADVAKPVLADMSTAERVPASASAACDVPDTATRTPPVLSQHLDELAYDIVSTPGAGGALLAAYAAQARALSMVVEAALRGRDAPLPASVLQAAQAALVPPHALPGLALL